MTHSASITVTPGILQRTLVIENVQNQDTVTVMLEIHVDCNCTSKTGSYTDTSYSNRQSRGFENPRSGPASAVQERAPG